MRTIEAEQLWVPGPAQPRLAGGEMHLWRAELSEVPGALAALLSADERERAGRIIAGAPRELWRSSRAVLRDLLGRYVSADPTTLRLTPDSRGKPTLDLRVGQTPIHFNLSHSRGSALYAFSRSGPIGVDLERSERTFDYLAVARRAFDAAESRRLSQLDQAALRREFLAAWTLREAYFKYGGRSSNHARARAGAPWAMQLTMFGGAAAVVAAVAPRTVDQWDYVAPELSADGSPTRPR